MEERKFRKYNEPMVLKSNCHYCIFLPIGANIIDIEKIFDLELGLNTTLVPVKGLTKIQIVQIISKNTMRIGGE